MKKIEDYFDDIKKIYNTIIELEKKDVDDDFIIEILFNIAIIKAEKKLSEETENIYVNPYSVFGLLSNKLFHAYDTKMKETLRKMDEEDED